ncbi:MAG: hypothetical protein JXL97_17675 [Bacteroidales bacterium]|nr:hypothetical protein [Bacteroidales bacterium]
MSIDIREVKTNADLRKFIYLPAKIHKGHSNWVPPIYDDEFNFFNKKKNKSFEYCDTILLLAYKNNVAIGRIMGIIHKKYNEIHNENNARFSFLETYEDIEIFNALLDYLEKWAKNRNCTKIVGPLGFSDKDPQGFMTEGFEEPIVISSNGNFPFMPDFMKTKNYEKEVDLVVYKIPVPNEIPPFYQAIYNRALKGKDIEIIEFNSRKQLKPFIKPILHLLNETFEGIYGFVPFEEHEMNEYANRYIYLLDPQFIKVVATPDKKPIGFIIAMPDISQGVIKTKGRLLPFGFFRIIALQKKTKQLTLLLGGIKKQFRGQGLDVILGKLTLESAIKRGFEFVDSHLELENNTNVRKEMEKMGGVVYKRYRIYQKNI